MWYLLIFISILPVYLIGLYIYRKDKAKEPKKLLKRLFIFGMLSCIPAAITEILLGKIFGPEESMNLVTLFFYVLISVALIEELFKWLLVYFFAYNHREFDELYDAIVYAAFVSLGFACFENIFYVLDSGIGLAFFRAITAIPGHVGDAIIMGNYLGLAKLASINGNMKLCRKNIILSLLMPTIMHTIYDFCLFSGRIIFLLLFAVFLVFVYVYGIKKIKKVSANSNGNFYNNDTISFSFSEKRCRKCGSLCDGDYCRKCDTKQKSS